MNSQNTRGTSVIINRWYTYIPSGVYSMSKHTMVRLPDETGRTATYYISEAIEEHLEDL